MPSLRHLIRLIKRISNLKLVSNGEMGRLSDDQTRAGETLRRFWTEVIDIDN